MIAARYAGRISVLSIIVTILALFVAMRVVPVGRIVGSIEGWIDGLGIWAPIVFAAIFIVAAVLMLPGAPLTLAAGAIFGLTVGVVSASIGSTLGAAAAFLVARHLARAQVVQRLAEAPRLAAIDRAIGAGGWRIVALLRLSPAVPFNLQNYVYGVTAIRFWPCVITSWIAMLPGTFMYVYIGYVARRGAETAAGGDARGARWILIGLGLVATVALTVYLTRIATRALRQHVDDDVAFEARAPRWTLRAKLLPVLAIAATCAAVLITVNREAVERRIGARFGPPRVVLAEAYVARPDGPRFDHAAFDALLGRHVDDAGLVDYGGLARDEAALDAYIGLLADAPMDVMGRDERLALLINAYNAFTLKLILEHRPVDSILDIPPRLRWDDRRWIVGGRTWSLNEIEHEQIRPKFIEPRVHFALVCAAVGCPPLRGEAYDGSRIDRQLAEQARIVHQDDRWFRLAPDGSTVELSMLYSPSWYGADFEQTHGTVLRYAAAHAPPLQALLDAGTPPRVAWIDYDWRLNAAQ